MRRSWSRHVYVLLFVSGLGAFWASVVAGLCYSLVSERRLPGIHPHETSARALRLKARGDSKEAAREYQVLSQIDPSDLAAHEAFAQALADSGDRAGELEAYLRALAKLPMDSRTHTALGLAFLRHGRTDEALGSLVMAVRLNPSDPAAHTAIGDLLRVKGRPREAAQAYRNALSLSPPSAILHNKLGIALATSGLYDAALQHFTAATSIDPGFAEARENRRRAQSAMGSAPAEGRAR